MRIHTALDRAAIFNALPAGVAAHVAQKGSRKRAHAFEVTLYVFEKDELHRRYGNSGGYGASDEVAATWDEWGVWIARLYALDPEAIVAWYESPAHFIEVTRKERDRVRAFNKPESVAVKTHTAPWLEEDMAADLLSRVRDAAAAR